MTVMDQSGMKDHVRFLRDQAKKASDPFLIYVFEMALEYMAHPEDEWVFADDAVREQLRKHALKKRKPGVKWYRRSV